MIYPWFMLDDTLARSALPGAPVLPDAAARGSRFAAARNAWQVWRATRAGWNVDVRVVPACRAGALG